MKIQKFIFIFLCCFSFSICSCQDPDNIDDDIMMEEGIDSVDMNESTQAVITEVKADGSDNNYSFRVTIKSPDTGCDQYADWWEIVDLQGNLIYRRILAHSHVDEQPFTRAGNNIKVGKDQFVYIRGHMNTSGYSSFAFSGSPDKGFQAELIGQDFYPELENEAPQPKDCDF